MYDHQEQEAVIGRTQVATEEFVVSDSKVGIGVILALAAFVGLWGTACLISGLATLDSVKAILPTIFKGFLGV